MKKMFKRIYLIILILQFIIACGFTPTLKVSEENNSSPKIYYEVQIGSYIAKQTLNKYLKNIAEEESKYTLSIDINETESAVNIRSDGSVVEYRVEASIIYQLIDTKNSELIYSSQSRGFSNYDVSNSEYTNTLVKNEALKTAINDAAQLMSIMVQSKISE
tara:strand:+ start:854 stop:1336 length:483 start_codon:yes stop_codon:yes gene_type:complete